MQRLLFLVLLIGLLPFAAGCKEEKTVAPKETPPPPKGPPIGAKGPGGEGAADRPKAGAAPIEP